MARWRVSIGPIVIVVPTVIATVIAGVIGSVVPSVVPSVVATILVIATPLRVVPGLSHTAVTAVVTRLGLVIVAIILALAPVVAAYLLAVTQERATKFQQLIGI